MGAELRHPIPACMLALLHNMHIAVLIAEMVLKIARCFGIHLFSNGFFTVK